MIRLIVCLIVMFAFPSSAQLGIYNGGVPQHLRLQGHSYNDNELDLTPVTDAIGFDFATSPWFWASANGGTAHFNWQNSDSTTTKDECTSALNYSPFFGCLQGVNQALQVDGACRFPTDAQRNSTYRHNFGALEDEATCLTDLAPRIALMPKERICIINYQVNDLKGAYGQNLGPTVAVTQWETNYRPRSEAALNSILDGYEAQGYRCILVTDAPYMGSTSQANEIRINKNAQMAAYTTWLKDTYLAQATRSQHEIADIWTEFTQLRENYGDVPFAQLYNNCANVPPTSCGTGGIGGTCSDVPVGCTDGIHPGTNVVSISGSPVSVTFTGKSMRGQIIARSVGVLKQRIRDGN